MSFSTTDTIVALATPRGRGALGLIRVSGSAAHPIFSELSGGRRLTDRRATVCRLDGLDQVVATLFAGPGSFTGEDVVEISAHGSPVVLDAIVEKCVALGARLARPGEFSLRAVLHGRIDLAQAEAVGKLVDAQTRSQAALAYRQLSGDVSRFIRECEEEIFSLDALLEASIDFSGEGYVFIRAEEVRSRLSGLVDRMAGAISAGRRSAVLLDGASVVLTGFRNAGKSSLFNCLVGEDRAIVSSLPGTTRDTVSETVEMDGLAVRLVDTAGLGETADAVESEGMRRAVATAGAADLVLVVADGRSASDEESVLQALGLGTGSKRLVVLTRLDLDTGGALARSVVPGETVWVSALTGQGVPELRRAIVGLLVGGEGSNEMPAISSRRQLGLLEEALGFVSRARDSASAGAAEEFVSQDLLEARRLLEGVVGRRAEDAVLEEVFLKFCIGK